MFPIFPSPYVSQSLSQSICFPVPINVHQSLCSPVPVFSKLTSPVPMSPTSIPQKFPPPIFPKLVPQSLCSPVPMIPKHDPQSHHLIHQSLCSLCSLVLSHRSVFHSHMFPKYVHQSLCSPVHMFPKHVPQPLCSPVLFLRYSHIFNTILHKE